jgi:5-hydroxyisourate hydrolase
VLDVARGVPAAGVGVTLVQVVGAMRVDLASGTTDGDGRIAGPFGDLQPGEYELVFKAGAYLKATGTPSFYDEIPVRFIIAESRHYHVPLLLAPWGYSTYRGS